MPDINELMLIYNKESDPFLYNLLLCAENEHLNLNMANLCQGTEDFADFVYQCGNHLNLKMLEYICEQLLNYEDADDIVMKMYEAIQQNDSNSKLLQANMFTVISTQVI